MPRIYFRFAVATRQLMPHDIHGRADAAFTPRHAADASYLRQHYSLAFIIYMIIIESYLRRILLENNASGFLPSPFSRESLRAHMHGRLADTFRRAIL